MATPEKKSIVIDAFAGAGGNAIAFAQSTKWKRVYAIEKDPAILECAKHNAKIYGVEDKITWFQGDCFDILKNQLKDLAPYSVIFASPPWGGPGYRSNSVFNLSNMEPYSIETLYSEFSAFTTDMALFLPRTSDLRQLAALAKNGSKVMVMHYCMDGASKALCAYYGDLKFE
ncbi:putative diacylglycerol O-acyltransferase tgs1 [Emydomyces testavorans]|uniref:Trimethylguanosine synthase n=1 Tax=Emydomyces testavorans TaxID=2070801 RepID=A0AAF0IHQ6_9EURO|nr:putative diacylglycerol O-acyltransferase tgs1 [Emydomyces testavorans]